MKTVKLNSISEVKTEKSRTDGKVSRKYYTAYFSDPSNPFAEARQQNVFQSHNADGTAASWKSGDPSIVAQYIGKELPGAFVARKVAPYQIGERTVDVCTQVVLGDVNEITIAKAFKANGFTLINETAPVAASAIKEGSAALNA